MFFAMFHIVFEIVLLLTFFMIIKEGGNPERISAGLYFIIFSAVGSFPLFLKILGLCFFEKSRGTFERLSEDNLSVSISTDGMFLFFWYFSFFLKLPVFGGHF